MNLPKRSQKLKSDCDEGELLRLHELLIFEREARQKGFTKIAGLDEAGRGPLAGPVVAAACMMPEGLVFSGVDDSKRLTPNRRETLYKKITEHPSVIYGIGVVLSHEIDRINILQATMVAMRQAVFQMRTVPQFLLVDGLDLPDISIPRQKIIKGDSKSHSIAAASIIAKVKRDKMMCRFHEQWPMYGFDRHKGYGTKSHLEALRVYGPCPIHRMSFAPVRGGVN